MPEEPWQMMEERTKKLQVVGLLEEIRCVRLAARQMTALRERPEDVLFTNQ